MATQQERINEALAAADHLGQAVSDLVRKVNAINNPEPVTAAGDLDGSDFKKIALEVLAPLNINDEVRADAALQIVERVKAARATKQGQRQQAAAGKQP